MLPWVAALIAVFPLWLGGYPHGHDWSFELVRVSEYKAALAAGQWPPYWAENLYGGYGSPIFIFYAPLFLFSTSLLAFFVSVPSASIAVLVGLTFASVYGMRRCMIEFDSGDPAAARVASYVWVLSPYLLGDKLIRNANAEFTGLCLAPFVLAGLLLFRRQSRHAPVVLAGSLALVILAHNLTALVVTAIVIVGVGLVWRFPGSSEDRLSFRSVQWIALSIVLGLGLAAFFWVPALAMGSWMRPEQLVEGKFDFHRQFPAFAGIFGYGRFFSLGLIAPAIWLAGIQAWRVARADRRPWLLAALVGCAGLLGMMFPVSTPLWEHTPFLPLFQFPWRMAGPLSMMTALVSGLAFSVLVKRHSIAWRRGIEIAVLLACVVNAMPRLAAYRPLLDSQVAHVHSPRATVRDEYLPRPANPFAWQRQRPSMGPVVVATIPIQLDVRLDRGTALEFTVNTPKRARLRLARWDFPGWKLELNGHPATFQRNPFGSIDLFVPAGRSLVSLKLHPPPVRFAALWISALALVLLSGLALRSRRLPHVSPDSSIPLGK